VRVSTAFNKMLAIPGAPVVGVTFTPEGTLVDLRRRARRLTCACGNGVLAAVSEPPVHPVPSPTNKRPPAPGSARCGEPGKILLPGSAAIPSLGWFSEQLHRHARRLSCAALEDAPSAGWPSAADAPNIHGVCRRPWKSAGHGPPPTA
jgi:hypothetical protein